MLVQSFNCQGGPCLPRHSHLLQAQETLLILSPSSFGTCNHVLSVSQAGTPFHMFSREALPLGNFPTRYSGARCPSLTPQIRTTAATLGNRSHRHSVLSQHSGWRMLPAVYGMIALCAYRVLSHKDSPLFWVIAYIILD